MPRTNITKEKWLRFVVNWQYLTSFSSCLSCISLTIKVVTFNMRACLCYPNTAHIKKKHEIAPLTLSRQESYFPTLEFGDIEPLLARKGYHFEAKILPKRVLTLGASATRIHKNLLEYPLIPTVTWKIHADLLKANLFYRRCRLWLCAAFFSFFLCRSCCTCFTLWKRFFMTITKDFKSFQGVQLCHKSEDLGIDML